MKGTANKKVSISTELAVLVLVSAFVAALVFAGMNYAVERYIENHYESRDYTEKRNQKMFENLQAYIKEKEVSSEDTSLLDSWVKKKKVVALQIFKDDKLLYDSDYPDNAEEYSVAAEDYYGWESYYSVEFSDGTADVFISGNYSYQVYSAAVVVELILAFLLFMAEILLGIRKTIRYIGQLKKEIELLEVGNLDYAITVKGRDELSELAKGLDAMRLSLKDQMEQETQLLETHKKMVTEMSHDLRTPLTSILLYTEVILKEGAADRDLTLKYVQKIDKKASQMKGLTNRIFHYTLAGRDKAVQLEPAASFKSIFYDLLSETGGYLEQNGFQIEWSLTWSDEKIRINLDYISRIMDNITSNILKYADPEEPVSIGTAKTGETICIVFENKIRQQTGNEESTGIGVQNITNMMNAMGGSCSVSGTSTQYRTVLYFRPEN